jgi:hypothetical protein
MERDLPPGRAENLVEVVSATPPEEVVVRASQGPTPFTYRYRFTDANGGTMISLSAEATSAASEGCLVHSQRAPSDAASMRISRA